LSLRITNTLTGRKEDFVPLSGNEVLMYVCGPTVYGDIHIGNARSAVNFDVIRRYLRFSGYQVKCVINITDIDDKIIQKSVEEKRPWDAVAGEYTTAYLDVMRRLGVQEPDVRPRATDHIPEMIELVKGLIESGHAYPAPSAGAPGQDVLFDTPSFKAYGRLSRKNLEELMEGARVDRNDSKRNPTDFVLWKAAKPGEPEWDSPWGKGRPGWHIECSAMIRRHLGDSIDIHGGGVDLIFPHHENEIAQCEAYTGKPYVKYWLHNGFLEISGEKMSKSLGNILKAKDALDAYRPEVLRYFMLTAHYRSPLNYDELGLEAARKGWEEFQQTFQRISDASDAGGDADASAELAAKAEGAGKLFREAMDDDFNTSKAMGVLFELARAARAFLASRPGVTAAERRTLDRTALVLKELGGLLGIVAEGKTEVPAGVQELARRRAELKTAKRYAEADQVRNEVLGMGFAIEDMPGGKFRIIPRKS
jgi:cysteinyl-tRNA synthetase